MPEPLVTAIIAAASAIVGGVIAAVARPWGQDYVARRAEDRAALRQREVQSDARIERVGQILAGASVEGSFTSTAEKERGELPTATAAVDAPALSDAVGRMLAGQRRSQAWGDARREASHRVGQLLSEAVRK